MKSPSVLLRILCSAIDFLIIMIPVQFIMLGVFMVSGSQADLFFQLLYAVYGALMLEYCKTTVGKYFGRLTVADISGAAPTLLSLGIRELTKALYFIPYAGFIMCIISCLMMILRKDGRSLHDITGNTKVMVLYERYPE